MFTLNEWKDSGEYFEHKGFPIFYRRSERDADVLLCLHGFPTSSFDYREIWNALAESFDIVAPDLIGYGFSAKPYELDYTTFDQADLVEGLLRHLKIDRVHILAHDYGNTITQELLARDNEERLGFSIDSICFLNGALFPETHRPILAQKLLISPIGKYFGRFIPDGRFASSLSSIFGRETIPSNDDLQNYLVLFKHNNGKRIAHKLIRYMRERKIYRERWVGPLQKMQQPFLFINGSSDPVSGKHLVDRFREVVPHKTDIVELSEIGHFPHLEAAEIVVRHFFDFHDGIQYHSNAGARVREL